MYLFITLTTNFYYFTDDLAFDESGDAIDGTGEVTYDEEIDVATEVQIRKMRYEQRKFLEEKEVLQLFT